MRLPSDQWALQIAGVVAKRATCPRRQVGCVLVSEDGIVLATGYNGTPRGFPHCIDKPCDGAIAGGVDECLATHAEINALLQCADVSKVHTVAVTCYPCFRCLKALLNTGMKELLYKETYPGYEEFLYLLAVKSIAYRRY